jgi:hypothetical protein
LRLLDRNAHLLSDDELETAEDFRIHATGLEHRHLGDEPSAGAPRFPLSVNSLFVEG